MTKRERELIENRAKLNQELESVRAQLSEAAQNQDWDRKRDLAEKECDLMHREYIAYLELEEYLKRKQYREKRKNH